MTTTSHTAIIEKEGDVHVALCPELAIARQAATVEDAKANPKAAVELSLECADSDEVRRRGRHIVVQRHAAEGTTTAPVPDHAAVAIGTLLSIRQSGVSRSEFEA